MKDRLTKNTLFYRVFHSEELSPIMDSLFPDKVVRNILQFYPLRLSHAFLGLDTNYLIYTLSELSTRLKEDSFFISLGDKNGIFPFVIGNDKPFVLLIPGGGYKDVCVLNEGFMMALKLNSLGYNAFVCYYRTGKDAHFPNPQDDVASALSWIFDNIRELKVNPNDYAICGFSAGGHLAASWGTKTVGYQKYNLPKPKTIILGYPVITMGEFTHKESREYFLSEKSKDEEYIKRYSMEFNVDSDYPDTFLWACNHDKYVPYKNTLLFAEALKENHCRYSLNPYNGKAHGWGVAIGTPAEDWLSKAISFWQD